jgi:hypothetical protein
MIVCSCASHTLFASSASRYCLKNTMVIPRNSKGLGFKDLVTFFDDIQKSTPKTFDFFQDIYKVAQKFNFLDGFSLRQSKTHRGHIAFLLDQDRSAKSNYFVNLKKGHYVLTPTDDYTVAISKYLASGKRERPFSQYLEALGKSDEDSAIKNRVGWPYAQWQSPHCIVFPSRSQNILIIPKKGYTSVLTFAQRATEDEKQDAIRTIKHIVQDLGSMGIKNTMGREDIQFSIHVGSIGHQTEPHLHFRLELSPEMKKHLSAKAMTHTKNHAEEKSKTQPHGPSRTKHRENPA